MNKIAFWIMIVGLSGYIVVSVYPMLWSLLKELIFELGGWYYDIVDFVDIDVLPVVIEFMEKHHLFDKVVKKYYAQQYDQISRVWKEVYRSFPAQTWEDPLEKARANFIESMLDEMKGKGQ